MEKNLKKNLESRFLQTNEDCIFSLEVSDQEVEIYLQMIDAKSFSKKLDNEVKTKNSNLNYTISVDRHGLIWTHFYPCQNIIKSNNEHESSYTF